MQSYIELQEAKDYLGDRGINNEGLSIEHLVIASDYIDAMYNSQFVGKPITDRAWPRKDAYDLFGNVVSGVPFKVKAAAALVAVRAMGNQSLFKDYIGTEIALKKKVGPLEITYAEGASGSGDMALKMPEVELLLKPLLKKESHGAAIFIV